MSGSPGNVVDDVAKSPLLFSRRSSWPYLNRGRAKSASEQCRTEHILHEVREHARHERPAPQKKQGIEQPRDRRPRYPDATLVRVAKAESDRRQDNAHDDAVCQRGDLRQGVAAIEELLADG